MIVRMLTSEVAPRPTSLYLSDMKREAKLPEVRMRGPVIVRISIVDERGRELLIADEVRVSEGQTISWKLPEGGIKGRLT